jgi:hypothetical protein
VCTWSRHKKARKDIIAQGILPLQEYMKLKDKEAKQKEEAAKQQERA